jgi:hypothetical protein
MTEIIVHFPLNYKNNIFCVFGVDNASLKILEWQFGILIVRASQNLSITSSHSTPQRRYCQQCFCLRFGRVWNWNNKSGAELCRKADLSDFSFAHQKFLS